jgi:hypothetical protein
MSRLKGEGIGENAQRTGSNEHAVESNRRMVVTAAILSSSSDPSMTIAAMRRYLVGQRLSHPQRMINMVGIMMVKP